MNHRSLLSRIVGAWLVLVLLGTVIADDAGLFVGVAKRKVTPPTWVPYLTSSGAGTSRPFEGVHDDLFAKALVVDDGRQAIALLTVDAIGYDNAVLGRGRDFTRELRERVAANTGLKAAAIMLAASHTHSAPETIGLSPLRDTAGAARWLEGHLGELAQTVVDAWQARQPARVRFGACQVPGVARYRRIILKGGQQNRNGPLPDPAEVATPWQLDEQLSVLTVESADGRPLATLLNFTAHPVIAMLLPPVSADYPGAAMAEVERALPGSICLFTNGCAGNVNSIYVSTNYDDMDLLGRKLGQAAVETIARLRKTAPLENPQVGAAATSVELAARECPALGDARSAFDQDGSAKHGRLYRLAAKLAEGPIRAEVQMLQVGPVRWISLPGEPFVETGLTLKQAGASFVVGYANGYVGYLPIRRAYAEGGYEAEPGVWSRVAPGSAERLEAIAKELLGKGGGMLKRSRN